MAAINKGTLQKILVDELGLKEPRFKLEKYGSHWNGSIISKSFHRKGDHQRQKMIWDALRSALGEEARSRVGMILAYTPEEWDIDDLIVMPAKRKTVKSYSRRPKQSAGVLAG
jgi:acid stress-induced BolA-like protein IbaG/YrbA